MLETILLLLLYVVGGLVCLGVAAWTVISGQFFDIDGLMLAHICLAMAAVFFGALAIAVWKGEFREVLDWLRKPKTAAAPEGAGQQGEAPSRSGANTA